jgi:pyruvate-formate lyase-activating enzyme
MPPVEKHLKISSERTGEDFRELHEWIDDPDKKVERHDITKIHEYGKMIEEKYGEKGLQEYIQHIHDDVKAKFDHVVHDFEKTMKETLAYFGVKERDK